MKRFFLSICLLAVVIPAFSQGRVTTRRYRFADFPDKITKVVMSGDEIIDSAIREDFVENWAISPFEFCTAEDYTALRDKPDFYFFLVTEGKFKGEDQPGIRLLTLEKGGPDDPDSPTPHTEVVSLPLSPTGLVNGRELLFLPALTDAIRQYMTAAMESEKVAYTNESWFNRRLGDTRTMRIFLAESDLSERVTEAQKRRFLDEDFLLMDEDETDAAYADGTFNTLVSYVVAPQAPVPGASWCYKMLFSAEDGSLMYLHKHKITPRTGVGFLAEDLRRIAHGR